MPFIVRSYPEPSSFGHSSKKLFVQFSGPSGNNEVDAVVCRRHLTLMKQPNDDWFIEHLTAGQRGVHRFIATLVPNRADAEELLQETSVTAWRQRESFDREREMFPWLCGIARNLVGHYHRRQSVARRLEPEVLEQLAARQSEVDHALQLRLQALQHCLDKLPDGLKGLVGGYYGDELSVKELAAQREQSVEAIYKALQRTRQSLFACMSRAMTRPEGV